MNVRSLHTRWRFAFVFLISLAGIGFVPERAGAETGAAFVVGGYTSSVIAPHVRSVPSGGNRAASPGDHACTLDSDFMEPGSGTLDRLAQDSSPQTDHARLVFDPDVAPQDQELITEAVRLAEDFFAIRFGTSPGAAVTVTALPIACPRDERAIASTVGDSMVIYTGAPGWISSPPAERVRVVIHEYTHAYLFSKTSSAPSETAAWLEEGLAEYLSLIALSELGLIDREAMEGLFGAMVDHTDLPALQDLERYSAWHLQSAEVYQLAYFAVAQLLRDLPLSRIETYLSALGMGAPFAEAFELAFGMSTERFYGEFAQFRANNLPTMESFPDELTISEGTDQPSAATLEEAPEFVIPGQQTLVVANATPGANCTIDLAVADATVVIDDRETFADGSGQVFWLLTVPADLPSGYGDFVVSCGSDPLTIPVLVTS